jgi:nicotinate phosphoribosyltransferase
MELAFHRINSLLDNDFYAFTMSQVAWTYSPSLVVRYGFTNRTSTSIPLEKFIDPVMLRDEIESIRALRFNAHDIAFLRQQRMFSENYLNALGEMRLPEVEVTTREGKLTIEYEGIWWEAIFWETMLLALVNQLYYRQLVSDDGSTLVAHYNHGETILNADIARLRVHPIQLVEFGTRRRFDGNWQLQVLDRLASQLPTVVKGTSNVWLAKQFSLVPIGTMAHQLMMVQGAVSLAVGGTLAGAQTAVLDQWYGQYEKFPALQVALTDTWGTDFFLRNLEPRQAWRLTGYRQDSGDANERIGQLVEYNKRTTLRHTIIPSDGLTVSSAIELHKTWGHKAPLVFGIGTSLTNNVGYDPLSIVIKPIYVKSFGPCVKLSDNISKAQGPDDVVAKYEYLTDYRNQFKEATVY